MRINEVLGEAGALGTIASGIGAAGASSLGQVAKNAALGALGLKNTQNAYQSNNKIGAYSGQNASQLIKDMGIKAGMDFEISPGQKVKITKVDNTGATYVDPKTNLPLQLGSDALLGISQRQQAVQTVAQMSKPGATNAPATAP
jgi:hypothetical protein